MTIRILTVFGTRPEAIKLAPVVRALERWAEVRQAVCVTGQHRDMVDPVLDVFGIRPDFDLNLMKPGQDLAHITACVLAGLGETIDAFRPDWVVVQGDTTTAFSAALTAFYRKVKVAHVEAGLRTGDVHAPWPEEMNRRLISRLASVHFPPTPRAEANLLTEGVCTDAILVTGNTVIDALQWIAGQLSGKSQLRERFAFLDSGKRLILTTGHRRESQDGGLERVCLALRQIAARGDVEVIYPVHPSPPVQAAVRAVLCDHPAVHLVEPLDYLPFVYLMQRAHIIVSDSGGIQEEAPVLGKPLLVTRDTTERPEAIEVGAARLVGTEGARIIAAVNALLDSPAAYAAMAQAENPFGDGRAANRIAERLVAGDQSRPSHAVKQVEMA